jgi:hypothetical protein
MSSALICVGVCILLFSEFKGSEEGIPRAEIGYALMLGEPARLIAGVGPVASRARGRSTRLRRLSQPTPRHRASQSLTLHHSDSKKRESPRTCRDQHCELSRHLLAKYSNSGRSVSSSSPLQEPEQRHPALAILISAKSIGDAVSM